MQNDVQAILARWDLTPRQVRERLYQAPNPRERERWHALWLLGHGWSAAAVARALDRAPHTIGVWLDAFGRDGPAALTFEHTGGPPPPSPQVPKRDGKWPSRCRPKKSASTWPTGTGRWCASSSTRASAAA